MRAGSEKALPFALYKLNFRIAHLLRDNMGIQMKKVCFFICVLAMLGATALFTACGSDDVSSNPSGPIDFGDKIYFAFPINSIDKKHHQFSMGFWFSEDACIYRDSKVLWDTLVYSEDLTFDYTIKDHQLTLKNEYVRFNPARSEKNKSLLGVWNVKDDGSVQYVITQDTFYYAGIKTEKEEIIPEPVETPIVLGESYFMYDMYRCVQYDRICYFDQWHFSKKGPNSLHEFRIDVHDSTSNSMSFTHEGQEFFINVLHVQDDSLNNGKAYYSAITVIDQDTCFYEYTRSNVTEDLCKEENLKYLMGYSRDDEDAELEDIKGDIVMFEYMKNSIEEFQKCIYNHTKKQ